jgi:hypothetical protein
MNPWLDGMEMLGYYSRTVLYLLLMVVWGMLIVHRFLEKRFNPHLKSEDYISLLMSGWIVPVLLWAGLYTGSVLLFGETIGTALVILVMLLSLAFVSFKPVPVSSTFMALFLLFAIFMILRFAFLKNTSLPSYFDSAEHYRLIRYFVEPAGNPPAPYYHTGFHVAGAAFVRFFDLSVLDFMLAGGQFLLAILPLSFFSIIRKETGSITAGLFVVVLASFSWHMPAHLMNWGKYPALLSLVFLSFVLNFAYLLHCNNSIKYRNFGNYLLLAVVMLVSIFVHARLLIVYGMLAAAYILASWRIRSSLKKQAFLIVIAVLLIEFIALQNNTTLRALLDGYISSDGWTLILLLALTPFAVKEFPNQTFFLLASLSFFVAGLFVPVHLPNVGTLTILDRPYVQMLMYLPLSLLSGLGLAGLVRFLQQRIPETKLPVYAALFVTFGVVLAHALFRHDYYPSECCQITNRDDLALLTWIDTSLPPEAFILIAASPVNVTSLEQAEIQAGVDGGIWVMPLTSRQSMPAWENLDFTSTTVHAEICERGLGYVYAGEMPQSFSAAQLDDNPAWYQLAFALPRAKLYQVMNCQ